MQENILQRGQTLLDFLWKPVHNITRTRQLLHKYANNFANPTCFDPPTEIEGFDDYLSRQIDSWYKGEFEYLRAMITQILEIYQLRDRNKVDAIATHISRRLIEESLKLSMIHKIH